ncbi:hypothetical protein BS47DRAFT_1367972 [Hydnum rufescens UP504]|uniref:Uncharacterized protein n=1 Tax=Hydnum rufescens UP504 TaxID=1448309 RepID=A0A9P6AGX5_9AGAM|nr:hypothetical protein BS47DRAFT_1367972 [Hydnum rufescens UP504]
MKGHLCKWAPLSYQSIVSVKAAKSQIVKHSRSIAWDAIMISEGAFWGCSCSNRIHHAYLAHAWAQGHGIIMTQGHPVDIACCCGALPMWTFDTVGIELATAPEYHSQSMPVPMPGPTAPMLWGASDTRSAFPLNRFPLWTSAGDVRRSGA